MGVPIRFDMAGIEALITSLSPSAAFLASSPSPSCRSVAELLHAQSLQRPNCESLVYGSVKLSYAQLHSRTLAIAQQLCDLGISPGDRVGLLFPNHPDYVASFFAVAGLAATVVPINPQLKSEEIAHILSDCQASAIIVHHSALTEVLSACPIVPSLQTVIVSGNSAPSKQGGRQSIALVELTGKSSGHTNWPLPVNPDKDLAVLVYTSGTTGKPKGAMLTHQNLLFAVGSALDAFDVSPYDRHLAVLPLCHIYGLAVVMLGVFSRGGTLVIQDKFEAKSTLTLIAAEQITFLPAVPAMYQFMLMELESSSYDLSSVRLCLSGAAALPVDLIARIESQFQAPLIEGYGLTEVSCVGCINPLNGRRKIGSVGPAFPGVEVTIFDQQGPGILGNSGSVGEIAIKGPNVMQGYYGLADATEESFQNGWFLTGDLGYQDESGYIFIVGRKKELIIRGGQNIYPREVEEVILRLENVAEAAVIGVPDTYMGERVKAVVVTKPNATLTEDAVKAHCHEHLAEFKVPRLVEFVSALPRNSTGKVLKRLLQ